MPVARALLVAAVGCGLAAALGAQTPPQNAQKAKPPAPGSDVFVVGTTQNAPEPPASPVVTPAVKRLPDPSQAEIQHIIQVFTTKEHNFRELLKNDYVYTESVNMQELDSSGDPVGNYVQTNDINYTPDGSKQIICTYCPQPSLKDITVTEEDITDMFNMNMYTVSIEDLPQYNVVYVDHEPLDQITAYVFSITPKEIVKGHRYFSGKVYVDDRDLMIVKSDGRVVPNEYDKHGNPTNTFLPFQIWRQEVDGKYWFPVYTLMQGSIPGGPGGVDTPMKMVIQFKNYKRFRATTRILSVQALPDGAQPTTGPVKQPATPTIPH